MGRTISITISTPNTMASVKLELIYAEESFSKMPMRKPPNIAPEIDPIPPNTAAVNALIPGIEPVVGLMYE